MIGKGLVGVLCGLLLSAGLHAQDEANASVLEGTEALDGLMPVNVSHDQAKLYLTLPSADSEGRYGRFIHAMFLTAGMGSNPVGLDRSGPRGSQIIHFRRVGEKVMMVAENSRFTASADNPAEKKAVATSFAESILWSTKIVEETSDGGLVIDLSSFLTSDMGGIAAQLRARGQGSFAVDGGRSYVKTDAALAFPKNLEFDAVLTFRLRDGAAYAGREVQTTTPVPNSMTLTAHHTFLALPESGYKTRRYDHRMAMIPTTRVDMSAPLDGDVVTRMARRFRLELGEDGKVVKPIVFYVDNGAPEPIRSALVEGASWWATAFEKAGFPGGYRVEVLPEGAHPLDARYNVINWVHRATRGWSYGMTIADPRTGEVLRGLVILGSLRVRQDIKIFEALAGAEETGSGNPNDPVQAALARLRQLSAHEVGHPLGFSHNMAASTYDDRASVMDYPAPRVRVSKGAIDLTDAYGVGVGSWDDYAVRALYGDYGDQSDHVAQKALAQEAIEKQLTFVSDADSRAGDTGHALGAVWDNGEDSVEELGHVMAARHLGLVNFGAGVLREGESAFALQTKFVPLYLFHRYQIAAVGKSVGGLTFQYRDGGDGRSAPIDVPVARQQEAVEALLNSLSVDELLIPEQALMHLSPSGQSLGDPQFGREIFGATTRPLFDEASAVEAAARASLTALMAPARLERLAHQGARVAAHPGLGLLDPVFEQLTARGRGLTDRERLVMDLVERVYADHLIAIENNPESAAPVAAWARATVDRLGDTLDRRRGVLAEHAAYLADRIERMRASGRHDISPLEPAIPPGSPIGTTVLDFGREDGWP